jgi:hypothetical protein
MSQPVYEFFKKKEDNKWTATKRQLFFAVAGGISLLITTYGFVQLYLENYNFIVFVFAYTLFFHLLFTSISLLFIAMGLFSTTTEIDLQTRKVRIIRRNFRGQQAVNEMLLDDTRINATRMGITDANPTDIWIVKAGFFLENENGEEYDVAIYSKETVTIQDRNKIMLELYHFFFPDRQLVNEDNIITNGTAIMLLSDKELVDLKNGTLFQDKQKIQKKVDPGSKWDRIL